MEATLADWITAGFTAVLALFTLALVVVTGRYAEQTRLMVGEMRESRKEARRSREQSVLPKLALSLEYRGPTFALIVVKNVGPGAALDADIELAFEPREGSSYERDGRPWRTNLIGPGEEHWFFPPRPGGETLYVEGLAAGFERITLNGTVRDALAVEHRVDEHFDDLPGFYELNKGAYHVWRQDETVLALKERVGQPIAKAVDELRRAIDSLPRRQDGDQEP